MHILITDSGVGGLSVVAYAERYVRTHGFREPVRLTFANAAPENDYGYNSMPARQEKIDTFDRFLRNTAERFRPDLIYVACNTLSVLLADTPFFTDGGVPVKGIVETGAGLVENALKQDERSRAIIFATQTTIDAGTYRRLLIERGVDEGRIVSQACPGLADTISEDREAARAATDIRGWVATALRQMPDKTLPVVACLACTHYGYRRELFAGAFEEAAVAATLLNPNENAVDDLFGADRAGTGANREVDVQVVSRYVIPAATVETLTFFLQDISPRTVEAMKGFTHEPGLF